MAGANNISLDNLLVFKVKVAFTPNIQVSILVANAQQNLSIRYISADDWRRK